MNFQEFTKKYLVSIILALFLLGATFFYGEYVGGKNSLSGKIPSEVSSAENGKPSTVDFGTFWKVWNTINEKYVGTGTTTGKHVTDQEKVWGSIQGLVSSLGDPYTIFFPPAESKMFADEVSGNFEGIGVEIGVKDGALTVIAPLKNTPAYHAGILAGDKIVEIDGKNTSKLAIDEAIKLIRGKEGTQVKLTIERVGAKDLLHISVTRGIINIPTLEAKLLPKRVFLIELYNFSAISPDLFRQALRDFINSGTNKLILDLRGNPGGYLEAAIDMASWFLPVGDVVVTEDYSGSKATEIFRSKGYNIFTDNLKFAILVDGGSASASEILAGALREHGIATLVGEKTFGKGSVQELIPITSDTSLKVTIARWLTPNGTSISEKGITPDILVPAKLEDLKAGLDRQLGAAVEFLLKK